MGSRRADKKRAAKPRPPPFPPRLKLTGEDAEGEWRVVVTGVSYVPGCSSDDPSLPEWDDRPTMPPLQRTL